MWSPLFSGSPDTAGCPHPLPGRSRAVIPPPPGLSRGEEPADRGSLSIPAGPRSRSCQPIGGVGSSWTSPAMCVLGGMFVLWLPGETQILHCALSPASRRRPQSTSNQQAWAEPGRTKPPLAAQGQAGRMRQLLSQPGRPGSQPCRPLCLSRHASCFCHDMT